MGPSCALAPPWWLSCLQGSGLGPPSWLSPGRSPTPVLTLFLLSSRTPPLLSFGTLSRVSSSEGPGGQKELLPSLTSVPTPVFSVSHRAGPSPMQPVLVHSTPLLSVLRPQPRPMAPHLLTAPLEACEPWRTGAASCAWNPEVCLHMAAPRTAD